MAKMKKVSANARAIGGAAQGVGFVVIVLVVLFSDVMFVSLLWNAFPGGVMTLAAVGGAFATGISIIALTIGKTHWFRPGSQLIAAWCFTGIEVFISVMNVVTSVAVAKYYPLGYLTYWVLIAPATPLVALVGWIIVIFLDSARAELHQRMEMEDEKREAELAYEFAEHEAHMAVKNEMLTQYQSFLLEEARSPANLALLRQGAHRMSQNVISGIIGAPVGQHETNYIAAPPTREVTGSLATPPTPAPSALPQAEVQYTNTQSGSSESIADRIKSFVGMGGSDAKSPLAATGQEPNSQNGHH